MGDRTDYLTSLPPEQQRIRDKCYHPTDTFVPFPKEAIEQSIPARFEQIERQCPDRLAVKARDRALTYRELNQSANRVAQAILAERGEEREPVALLLEQGIAPIVAILGILKAGKFYVPLDPLHPQARTQYVLSDSQARLTVTHTAQLARAREIADSQIAVLNIDDLPPHLPTDNPAVAIAPDTLAYLMYTSGSTGRPKGVMETHRNVLSA